MNKLKYFIDDEEFDTDSICMDIQDHIQNIYNQTKNQQIKTMMEQFINMDKSM